ncbi:hypothetical protein M5E03_19035 (plasmid) [Bacillus safensis]|uniref:hypothetical protein n=1 Tax=Bacillus safensis TaxID=561879 RepID=UPI00207641D3|nr:hypothetical protein [Bacillus safensis]USD81064.1 hypothetical protein M5E03_19035 [Bacillus safensis]
MENDRSVANHLSECPSYTHQKMRVFRKANGGFLRKFGMVFRKNEEVIASGRMDIFRDVGCNISIRDMFDIVGNFIDVEQKKSKVRRKNDESTVNRTEQSEGEFKELTHSPHPKPIDSNKPRLFAPAEGASPEDRG